MIGTPVEIDNVIGSVTGPKSFLIHGERVAGAFSPRGVTWNAQVEHSFSKLFRIRGVYTDNRSVGLIVLNRDQLGSTNEIVMDGKGRSRYRQAELTARLAWKRGNNWFSRTHTAAPRAIRTFRLLCRQLPPPFIRPDVYSNLPGDLPNRFLVWGHIKVPFQKFELLPTVEYRNGFPYTAVDVLQNYVGVPHTDATRICQFLLRPIPACCAISR